MAEVYVLYNTWRKTVAFCGCCETGHALQLQQTSIALAGRGEGHGYGRYGVVVPEPVGACQVQWQSGSASTVLFIFFGEPIGFFLLKMQDLHSKIRGAWNCSEKTNWQFERRNLSVWLKMIFGVMTALSVACLRKLTNYLTHDNENQKVVAYNKYSISSKG